MQRHEFRQIELSGSFFAKTGEGNEKIESRLNELSAEGWEIVNFSARPAGEGFVYLFKRPLPIRKDP